MHLTTVVPAVGQLGLEVVDRVVAALDLVGLGELADPRDQHVLVVGPVEDADVARARAGALRSATGSRAPLLVGGRLERRDPDALRVDQADRVAEHAALAGGVHALEDQQHASRRAGGPLGEQPLLEVGQLGRRARTAPPCRRPSCRRSRGRRRSRWRSGRRGPAGGGHVGDCVGHGHIMAHPARRSVSAHARGDVEGAADHGVRPSRRPAARRTTRPGEADLLRIRSEAALRWSGAAK